MLLKLLSFVSISVGLAFSGMHSSAAEWAIPAGGNVFQLSDQPGEREIKRDGTVRLTDECNTYGLFFHVDKPAKLQLSLSARAPQGKVELELAYGDSVLPVVVNSSEIADVPAGSIDVRQPGYVKVIVRKTEQSAKANAEILTLLVSSDTDDLNLHFVRDNKDGMFYWGRRGPSVHLNYQVPSGKDIQYAYTEITVPENNDVPGSYFMANGFSQGYFGFQSLDDKKRLVLFSVWSPFNTDNPKEIPEDQRIVKLASGKDVKVGEFGNEGSGGQSFLQYPWKTGRTYRFLTEVKPDGDSHTIYTSWFGDKEENEWKLIASFRRPQTKTYLTGYHSFLENFYSSTGHIARGALYGNQWVCDTEGAWHECTGMKLGADNTANVKYRLDYAGGTQGNQFFMRNCGFEETNGELRKLYTRESSAADKPEIDFQSLPKQ